MVKIELTREEIYTLQAAFEVLVKGGGTYQMLRLPEILKTHVDLLAKFTKAMKAVDRG